MIRLLTSVSGNGFTHNYGAEVDFKDAAYEKRMVESGQAEYVVAAKKATIKK
jgi:hypothetical protein